MSVFVRVTIYIYISIYIYTHIHIYIYIYIPLQDKQTQLPRPDLWVNQTRGGLAIMCTGRNNTLTRRANMLSRHDNSATTQ